MLKFLLILGMITSLNAGIVIPIDKGEFKILYSPIYKGAVSVSYELDKRVSIGNIKERMSFYKEPTLPYEIALLPDDFTNTGFDRGHMASDASFDWNKEVLNKTYSMANIVLQYPKVNREVWASIEEIERYTAVQFGKVFVENKIFYGKEYLVKKPINEGKDAKYTKKYERDAFLLEKKKIRVPTGFLKIISAENFKECYYVENKEDIIVKPVKEYKVNCEEF